MSDAWVAVGLLVYLITIVCLGLPNGSPTP